MELNEKDLSRFLEALVFASKRHSNQRRKGRSAAPYINHPIEVAELIWRVGGVRDIDTLLAALLHDTVEDTATTPEEIRQQFGEQVMHLVMEVTDDKSLPKAERKRLQVVNAPHKSIAARQIKLADKASNVREITEAPPADWPLERQREYLDWTQAVIDGLRGPNPALEGYYDQILAQGRAALEKLASANP